MGIIEEAHNVNVLGSGEQVVMVCHGFGTDQSVWKHLVPHLVNDYRVILYDHMGCGTTNPEYFDFTRYSTIEGYVLDVLAILEEFQVKSCIFIGHSVKAMVGAIASISRPDMFSKLITIGATPSIINDVDYCGGFEQKDMDQLFEGMMSNYESWCLGFAPLVVGSDMSSDAAQEFSRTLFNMRPDIALCMARAIFQSDMRHVVPLVKIPTHILHSKDDTVVPVSVSEYLHRNLGGKSVVEILPTSGHLPQLSSPDILVTALLKHIRCDVDELVSDD